MFYSREVVKHKRGKPLKSGEKNNVKMYSISSKEFMFKQIRFPYTSKRTRLFVDIPLVSNDTRNMHVSQTFGANGGTIYNAIPVYASQSEINERIWICWHQDRSSNEFGAVKIMAAAVAVESLRKKHVY